MTVFDEAWYILKELSPSAQSMQDRARQFINDPKMGRSDRADAFHRQMNMKYRQNQGYSQPQMQNYVRMASQGKSDFNQAHRRGERMNRLYDNNLPFERVARLQDSMFTDGTAQPPQPYQYPQYTAADNRGPDLYNLNNQN